ncbi:DNA alkylation repair protein [Sphingobacterium sp. HJSM2_6]|uniref:DNA alkylation repair protein n=1 Tax=Sphingobacterium sp. HJSM2_6 TaxID=3366264 RepID=UPI003BC88BAE
MKANLIEDIIEQLKNAADPKVYQIYQKQGAQGTQFGVKMGDIRKIAKQLKNNHELALNLWDTKILEAQFMAILNFKASSFSTQELTELSQSANFPHLLDWLFSYVIKLHPEKDQLRLAWLNSKEPSLRRLAWQLTASSISKNEGKLELKQLLKTIEETMLSEHYLVQWTMNSTLASIGICNEELREQAIHIGNKLALYQDYPVSKGCVSPFAPIWIEEMAKRANKN